MPKAYTFRQITYNLEEWNEGWEILISLRTSKMNLQATAPRAQHKFDRTGTNFINRGVTAAKKTLIDNAKHITTKKLNYLVKIYGDGGVLRLVQAGGDVAKNAVTELNNDHNEVILDF